MKSLALFGFILLGAVNAHRLADSETTFLNVEDVQNVHKLEAIGNIDESLCVFTADSSIYNLNKIRNNDNDYQV
jgi:hypothetical protein